MDSKIDIDNMVDHLVLGSEEYPDIADMQEQACFYKMERNVTRYAKKFFHLLCGDDLTNEDILPLVFRDRCEAVFHNDCHMGQIKVSKFYPKQAEISIVLPRRTKHAYLHKSFKRTIRHELIHYYLWIKDVPWEDNTALFWAYCYIFDAEAYKPLSDEEQAKYDKFLKRSNEATSIRSLTRLAAEIILNDAVSSIITI